MKKIDAELGKVRKKIDAIDSSLQKLLNDRAALALKVGEIKQAAEGEEGAIYYRPEREAQILARIQENNEGPLNNDDIARLFREIISCCLNLEQPLTIAYLGPAGTYTEAAAVKQFGQFARTLASPAIDEVFRQVESGRAHYGVVPVENSTEGMVNRTLDCFSDSKLTICAEIELPIHHALMISGESEVGEIKEILSHPQSLAQCRRWLDENYSDIPRKSANSNSEAALIASERVGVAAIAGEMAADHYELKVVERNIEDYSDNKTRFLVIGNQLVESSGRDKTSILVFCRNEPGALFKVLEPFNRHEISLTRLETRPAKVGDWSYIFFIDFDGHQTESAVQSVLKEIELVAIEVRILGSYPQAIV